VQKFSSVHAADAIGKNKLSANIVIKTNSIVTRFGGAGFDFCTSVVVLNVDISVNRRW
jgi:hypothetical protein